MYMSEKVLYTFDVNGFTQESVFHRDTVETVFIPLLRKWTDMQQKKGGRLIVFLAAPPACGKSTVARLLEHLSETTDGLLPIQAVGIDGFHFHQDYILTHTATYNGTTRPMKEVKGSPETYDVEKLLEKLTCLKKSSCVLWPDYSRIIHDVVEDKIPVSRDIVLVEGNWLLYPHEPWNRLHTLCDYSIFASAQEPILRSRLLTRKMRGGSTREEALTFWETGDSTNVRRALSAHLPADLELLMTEDGRYINRSDSD